MIEFISWWSPFVIFGLLYLPIAILFFIFYPKDNKRGVNDSNKNNSKSSIRNMSISNISVNNETQVTTPTEENKPVLLRRLSVSARNALKNAKQDMVTSLKVGFYNNILLLLCLFVALIIFDLICMVFSLLSDLLYLQ